MRRIALAAITTPARRRAQQATRARAAQLGIAALHECAGPEISGEDDGARYADSDQIHEHVRSCTEYGMPMGFHAIGDGALDIVLDGFARASAELSLDAIRAVGHRVEHAELIRPDHVRPIVEYGLTVSAQPAFDALWGGADGMYAARLSPERAKLPKENVGRQT